MAPLFNPFRGTPVPPIMALRLCGREVSAGAICLRQAVGRELPVGLRGRADWYDLRGFGVFSGDCRSPKYEPDHKTNHPAVACSFIYHSLTFTHAGVVILRVTDL
jgi:hypothetical protein